MEKRKVYLSLIAFFLLSGCISNKYTFIESARLMTAALGLGSESGEFVEIVKKMFLQGKPPSQDNIFHMKRELGDIMWYWATACAALDLDPHEVIAENQKKLEARYGEQFEVQRSEVRKEGDL